MNARPILFSGSMIRALLEGRKTQTRRVVKPQPSDYTPPPNVHPPKHPAAYLDAYCSARSTAANPRGKSLHWCWWTPDNRQGPGWIRCPYGVPGDLLWVKETHAIVPRTAYAMSEGVQQVIRPDDAHDAAVFAAGWERSIPGRWRPSIHMPKWASRLTLRIKDIRLERVTSCSREDAIAEGLQRLPASGRWVVEKGQQYAGLADHNPVTVYSWLWESINGEGSWTENPWVWVVEFEVHQANVADVLTMLEGGDHA